jgi:hypothetical protein
VPRGIEVLVKKASVDAEFRELLLKQRGKAAAAIQLELDPAESAMLSAIPQEQLARTVDQTTVPTELRSAFQGRVALVMLAALGVGLAASSPAQPPGAQPNPSNAIPPQAQATNPPSYVAVAGAVPLPDKTTTNVPPANVENTNPPPPPQFIKVAGLMMRVPPSPDTNTPATNTPPPQQPFLFESAGLMMRVPSSPDTNGPATNAPGDLTRTNPPSTNAPSTNAPGEITRTDPPFTNLISPPIGGLQPYFPTAALAGMMATPPADPPPQPQFLPVMGLMMRVPPTPPAKPPPTNAPGTNAPDELTRANPPSTNETSPAIHGLQPNVPLMVRGMMATPPAKPPPTNAPGTNAPGELTRTDPPSEKQPPAT